MIPRTILRHWTTTPTITEPNVPDWEAALCRQGDPELFFPDTGRHDIAHAAIRICTRCPLRQTCLDYAITHRIRDGIWGGLTEKQRRTITHRDPEGTAA